MDKANFLMSFNDVLNEFERKEISNLAAGSVIYYAGDIPEREFLPNKMEPPMRELDDEEGYYKLIINDHILHKYQILKILGKGSFAQVVSCLDHQTGKKVAIKINRNTEIDHKFAEQEAKLLKFLMEEDPLDQHNIVRMQGHIHFRNHQCFVFELLHTDLFEHLKDNNFEGFTENKIQSYCY